ncbi:MAG: hypothetical protein EP319_08470 [Deltaproteobacteria bacterium]|nr:MAG: hypothetical protein EP319_08470 [Deltaproteobacteria bacterium]
MSNIAVNEDFKNLALSHYGYDGGNLESDLWFSGIEWGGGINVNELKKDIQKAPFLVPFVDDLNGRKKYLKYQFDRKLLKILVTALGKNVTDYHKEVLPSSGAYSSTGPMFKLNLYPISFKNTSPEHWTKEIYDLTGFPTKELYMGWIQQERFEFFNNLVKEHKPKVIVCAGISFKKDFLLAYGGIDSVFDKPIHKLKLGNKKSPVEVYESRITNDTKLVITPFFGNRYGINRNDECEKIGNYISGLI